MSYQYEADLVADCKALADKCGLKLERIGQRKAKGSGTERGAPDAFLYVAGFAHPLEFKRPKPAVGRAGRCSLEQMAAAERRRAWAERRRRLQTAGGADGLACCAASAHSL